VEAAAQAAQRQAAESRLRLLEAQLEPHSSSTRSPTLHVLIGLDPAAGPGDAGSVDLVSARELSGSQATVSGMTVGGNTTSFGLRQVRERLATHYGGAASLSLDPAVGAGGGYSRSGLERSRFRFTASTPVLRALRARMDSVYLDIVTNQRVVLAYTMTVGGKRISASQATFELQAAGTGYSTDLHGTGRVFEGGDGT